MATANMIPITLTKTPLVFLDEKLNIVETSFLHKKICIYIHYNTKRSGTQMYPIFTCVVVFCLWLRYELGKSDKIARKQKERLLELEHDANFTRRQSLDGLHYITFSEKVIPIIQINDSTLNKILSALLVLCNAKIVKLSQYSNTELKKLYGPANLDTLSEYDNNYTTLIRLLQQYAKRLNELSYDDAAIQVLEYAISIESDMGSTYKLLADLYHEHGQSDKIHQLLDNAKQINPLYRETTVAYIQKYLS